MNNRISKTSPQDKLLFNNVHFKSEVPKIMDKANIIQLQNSYIHLLEGVQGCRCLWLYIGSISVTKVTCMISLLESALYGKHLGV